MAMIGLSYDVEFKSTADDAWYTSAVVLDKEKQLRVKFKEFEEPENDEVFSVGNFTTLSEVDDFVKRFRAVAVPVEDNECSTLVQDMTVCATYTGDGSLRYFDAIVDTVLHKEHTPAKCLCIYLLCWLHGPQAGNLTASTIDDICFIKLGPVDPKVTRFANMVKETITRSKSLSAKGKSPFLSRKENSNQPPKRLQDVDILGNSSSGGFSGGSRRYIILDEESDEDRELEGCRESGCHHYIILENLEKDVSPSLMMKFIHEHTSIMAQAYVFQSSTAETYARGMILSDSRVKMNKIYNFVSNPNHLIVSLAGRPWVLAEDTIRSGTFKTDFRSLQPNPEFQNENKLKIVRLGTEEFQRAKRLKEVFVEYRNHVNKLLKTLDVQEKKHMHE